MEYHYLSTAFSNLTFRESSFNYIWIYTRNYVCYENHQIEIILIVQMQKEIYEKFTLTREMYSSRKGADARGTHRPHDESSRRLCESGMPVLPCVSLYCAYMTVLRIAAPLRWPDNYLASDSPLNFAYKYNTTE